MKKILFAMLLFVGLLSSLYGAEPPTTLSSGCNVEIPQPTKFSAVTTVSDEAIAVNILHKDTLMRSWIEEHNSEICGVENDGHDETTAAVVCYLRGESGV